MKWVGDKVNETGLALDAYSVNKKISIQKGLRKELNS